MTQPEEVGTLCARCGYRLSEPVDNRCPGCGWPTDRVSVAAPAQQGANARPTGVAVELFGRYKQGQVTQSWSDEPRPTSSRIEAAIKQTWEAQLARAGRDDCLLYDGPLVRLIRAAAAPSSLHLELGPTSYRDFIGTNLHNAAMTRREQRAGLANPLGVSATVITRDGFLAYGRRSRRVAYHAGYLHAFGGMIETEDRLSDGSYDIFGSIKRELREELTLCDEEIEDIVIVGLVRDRRIHQPELLFEATLTLSREALTTRFHPELADGEHTGVEFIRAEPHAIVPFLEQAEPAAPVAQSAVLLYGRRRWGEAWYGQAFRRVFGALAPSTPADSEDP